jgi:monoamine oxidase
MNESRTTVQYDIAIVGGGVSGIYTGWRLLDAGFSSDLLKNLIGARGKLDVCVFEGSDRIGGRLLSARPPGMPHVTCEIGGMRYVSSQKLIRSLVENKLELPHHEQVVDDPNNIALIRGKHLRMRELQDPSNLPYDLRWAEANWIHKSLDDAPAALIAWAINQVLPETTKLHDDQLREYLKRAKVDGTPLYKHGFWNLLARSMSSEARMLARTMIGYDCLGDNANALDTALEYFDFTPKVRYYLIHGGYEVVPWTLEQRFKALGGTVDKGSWLTSFDSATLDDNTKGVTLHFANGHSSVKARAIVLAMPRRSLELLNRVGPVLDPSKAPKMQYLLSSAKPVPLFKVFIAYAYPWWEAMGVSQGRSMTDLPIRQCYYWATEGNQAGADPNNRNAILMAYNDALSVEFWGGLRPLPTGPVAAKSPSAAARARIANESYDSQFLFQRQPMPHAHAGGNAGDDFSKLLVKNWTDHEAPAELVAEAHRELVDLHGLVYSPDPLEAAYMDWSDDPFGGGVHLWNPGYRSWMILEQMIKPVDDFPCYICGEAYSTNQTWVEGALQTAELVLQNHFGLAAPDWITEEDEGE